jgi:hypothetical protein
MGANPYHYESLKALAEELKRPVGTLIALAPGNDPFYAGSPASKEKADWFARQWQQYGLRAGAHLRRVHYTLVSQAVIPLLWDGTPYENTEEVWGKLVVASKAARALNLVPSSAFVDRRNPEPIVAFAADGIDAELEIKGGGSVYGQYGFANLPPLPTLKLTAPAIGQRYMVEIWVEKSTINEILIPLNRRYGVGIQTGVGEISETRCEQLVDRAAEDGRPVRILYISDFDPGGQSMPVAAARKIDHALYERGLDLDIQVRPVFLSHDQCVEYNLPRTPLKETEHRAARFEARYGEGATELDALEALHPGEINRVLVEEIGRYYDDDLDDRIELIADQLNEQLDEINEEVHEQHEDELAEIRAAYADLSRRMQAELRTISERYSSLCGTIQEALQTQAPDLDEVEWPEPEEGDEDDDSLFDSTRGYVEQMDRYKAHQGKRITFKERVSDGGPICCQVCDRSFLPQRKGALYCSPACKIKAYRQRKAAAEPESAEAAT